MRKQNKARPKVTVVCCTYNHCKFIAQALDSFVMQQTDFPFIVLVHDDASTDGTAEIIREYQDKFPDLIYPIFQDENQYSQGISIRDIILPQIQTEYVALCEGDDYWTSNKKLQIQYDYLSNNPDCSICVHQATQYDWFNGKEYPVTNEFSERDYSTEDIILGGGGLFATNTLFMKTEAYLRLPHEFKSSMFGDYQLTIFASSQGRCHYFPLDMSVYNWGVTGSWTLRHTSCKKRIAKHYEVIRVLKEIDKYYNYKYTDAVTRKINEEEYCVYRLKGFILKMIKKRYRLLFETDKELNGIGLMLKECFAARFSNLYRIIRENKSQY